MSSRLTYIQKDIAAFMREAGQTVRDTPTVLPKDEANLRIALITEEYDETVSALIQLENPALNRWRQLELMADVADGVADMIYVLVGATLAMGIDLNEVWSEVQRANMEKMTGPIRPDGKRMKPADWRPPNVGYIVADQMTMDEMRGWNCA